MLSRLELGNNYTGVIPNPGPWTHMPFLLQDPFLSVPQVPALGRQEDSAWSRAL